MVKLSLISSLADKIEDCLSASDSLMSGLERPDFSESPSVRKGSSLARSSIVRVAFLSKDAEPSGSMSKLSADTKALNYRVLVLRRPNCSCWLSFSLLPSSAIISAEPWLISFFASNSYAVFFCINYFDLFFKSYNRYLSSRSFLIWFSF